MGDTRHFSLGNFSGAEIETAIDLPRVSRDDDPLKFFSEVNAERGFSRSGRAKQNDDLVHVYKDSDRPVIFFCTPVNQVFRATVCMAFFPRTLIATF